MLDQNNITFMFLQYSLHDRKQLCYIKKLQNISGNFFFFNGMHASLCTCLEKTAIKIICTITRSSQNHSLA